MTDESEPLTKVTAFLFERSMLALEAAAKATGDSPTETINRAVQLYDHVIRLHASGNGRVLFDSAGVTVRIEVNRPWWRFW